MSTKEHVSSPTHRVGESNPGQNDPGVVDKILSFGSLYKAAQKCRRNVRWKDSVSGFTNHSLMHILKLWQDLISGNYHIQKYSKFFVYEPKKRAITSTRFRDRVFQRSLCDNYLYKEITKNFIPNNCACQIDKGTDYARKTLLNMYREYFSKRGHEGWVLKCDLKDFFGSTKHWLAKKSISDRVNNSFVALKVNAIIDSFGDDMGIGLGSQVSQLIQLAVLDDLDHFITKELGFTLFVRYMDDFVLISESKDNLQMARERIQSFLEDRELRLSTKKTQIFPITQPMMFLGFSYKLWNTGRVTLKYPRGKEKKERRKLQKLVNRVNCGFMSLKELEACYQSWRAHCKKSDSRGRMLKMDKYFKKLKGEIKPC